MTDQTTDPTVYFDDEIPFTIDEVLEMARLPETSVQICLRADLQADFDAAKAELATLVDADGEPLTADNADRPIGHVSPLERAHQVSDRMIELQGQMREHTRTFRFRAMTSDEWSTFTRLHKPKDAKNAGANIEFHDRLVCETAIKPTISRDDWKKMRAVLAPTAIGSLIQGALKVCTQGGLDIPKLPVSSLSLAELSSEG